jgi:rfaE bifunctional protein kinase chain/domain
LVFSWLVLDEPIPFDEKRSRGTHTAKKIEMDINRLHSLLDKCPSITLAVVGDYFLDKYLILDAGLSETSLETGQEAYQVVAVRLSPGAAGTVTSNLCALGVKVLALGVIGDDGEGLELERKLRATGVDVSQIVRHEGCFTPTYTKPMMRAGDGTERELNRLDIKNRRPLPHPAEAEVVARLRTLLPYVQGVVVVDQVEEPNHGVVTEFVRAALIGLAEENPAKLFAVESRSRVGLYPKMILKPNARELLGAIGADAGANGDVEACAKQLFRRAGAPVFVTRGAEGILLCDEAGLTAIRTVRVSGPIDSVGAGDSALAGIVASLCAGATRPEAALVGNLAASVTIRQIGTTGTANPQQILDVFRELQEQSQSLSRSAQSSSVQSSNERSSRPSPRDPP